MAPPKKRPPQGKPGQKRPPQGRRPAQSRKPAGASAPKSKAAAAQTGADTTGEAKAESITAADADAEASAEAAAAAGGPPLSKSAEERKAKREAARQERIAAARKRQQAKRRKQIAIGFVLLIVLVGGTLFSISKTRGERAAIAAAVTDAGCGDIESFEDEGQRHLTQNESYDEYKTNPPTSGPHRLQPSPWGSYRQAPEPETLVHNLEHGGIVIHYKDMSDEQVDEIDEFADSFVDGVIAAPNPDITKPIALSAWRHSQECEKFNTKAIEGFINDRCNKGPEKVGTTCVRE
jgi:hypothetical protein